jgi:hypothetical protein
MLYSRESSQFAFFLSVDCMEKAQESEPKAQITAMNARVEEARRKE